MRLRAALAALLLALPLAAVGSGAAHAAESPLTASFAGVPSAHDGVSPFSFDLVFSEPASVGYKTLRDDAFTVTGGSVTGARRVDGRSDRWQITVAPDVASTTDAVGDVSIELAATSDCDDDGAVCTADDAKALSNTTSATVAAPPPLVAAFESVPATHDTSAEFSFRLRFDTAVTTSYRILGGTAFDVAGGEVTGARRVEGRSDLWQITIQPDTVDDDTVDDDITITLPATTDCGDADAVCTVALRPLSEPVTASVEGPLVEAEQSTERGQRVTRGVPGDKEDEEEDRVGVRALPGRPASLEIQGGNEQVTVSWDAVTSDPAVTSYVLEYRVGDSGPFTMVSRGDVLALSETITGRTNYERFRVQVYAVNDEGTSGTRGTTAMAVPTVPLASANAHATDISGDGTTLWVADTADNKSYAYTKATGAPNSSLDFDYNTAHVHAAGQCLLDGFFWIADSDDDHIYAYNKDTRAHDTTKSFDLDDDNTNPRGVACHDGTIWVADSIDKKMYAYGTDRVRDSDSDITLHSSAGVGNGAWTDGTTMWISDTGGRLRAYDVAASTDLTNDYGIASTTVAGLSSPSGVWSDGTDLWITDIVDNLFYKFELPQRTAVVAPGVPTSVASTGGSDGSVTVTWGAPASDGGTAITSYDVRYKKTDDADAAAWTTQTVSDATTRSFTIGGLDLGVSYDVQVRADNGTDGEWSTSATAETGHDFELDTARPYDLTSDGTTVWVTDGTTRIVNAYSLSDGALDETKGFETVVANNNPTGICWHTDTFWVAQSGSTNLYAYNNDGTRNSDRDITLPTGTDPRGLSCTDRDMQVVDDTTDTYLVYVRDHLGTDELWVRSAPNDVNPSGDSGSDDPIGVWSADSGSTFVSDVSDTQVYAHIGAAFGGYRLRYLEFDLVSANDEPAGVWSDGTTMWVLDRGEQVAYGYRLPLSTEGGPAPLLAIVQPDRLSAQLAFNENLDRNVTPAAGAFEVTAGSDTITPSSIAHSVDEDSFAVEDSVTLTFSPALPAGETLTIAYTAPTSTDPAIQDAGGDVAESFSGFKVINRPSAPQNVAAAPGDTSLTVTWEAPAGNGGNPLTSYRVRYKLSTATTWTTVTRSDVLALTETITGLTNDLAYDIEVIASNYLKGAAAVVSATPAVSECAAPAYAGDLDEIWTGALTVGSFDVTGGTFYGYNSTTDPVTGALSETSFMVGTTEHTVESVSVGSGLMFEGLLALKFTTATNPAASVVNKLVLYACDMGFAMGGFAPGGTGGYTLDSDLDWSSETSLDLYVAIDDTVPELMSAKVTGTTLVLTYDEPLDESNAVPASAFAVTVAGGTAAQPSSVAVDGATVTLTLANPVTAGQTVTLTYTKQAGIPAVRDVFTNEAAALTDQAVVNPSAGNATGAPTISGVAQVGATLSASTDGIADEDGKTKADNGDAGYAYTYQWVRENADGTSPADISGATSSTYLLVAADVGKKIKVKVSFTDDDGNPESLTSEATGVVIAAAATTVTIAADEPAITNALSHMDFTLTRTGDTSAALTVTVTLTQTQQQFLSSRNLGGPWTATFDANATTADFRIRVGQFRAAVTESGELTATISPGTDYGVGTPGWATVAVKAAHPAMTARIEQAAYEVPEDVADGTATVHVVAQMAAGFPAPNRTLQYTLATGGDQAVSPGDFGAVSQSVSFGPGDWAEVDGRLQARKAVEVTIKNDGLVEVDESLNLILDRTAFLPVDVAVRTLPNGDNCPAAGCISTLTILNDDVLPMLDTATVNGVSLVLTYDRELDGDSDPAASAYSVAVDGEDGVAPTAVNADGSTVTLTLATAVTSGQSVTLDYTVPTMDPVTDSHGNPVPALDDQPVHNVAGDDTAPELLNAQVDGAVLVLTYNEALDPGSEPAVGDFGVQVTPSGGTAMRRDVSTVDVSGSKVTLTLASAVLPSDSVTMAYVVPSSNPLQDVAGNDAAGFSGQSVGNAGNSVPMFPDATLTRELTENTAPDVNVGAPIPAATDPDGHDLTYTLEGADATSFNFDATTRQITTKTGVTYDHEDKISYEVTIKVTDGFGGEDTVVVTIKVKDLPTITIEAVQERILLSDGIVSFDVSSVPDLEGSGMQVPVVVTQDHAWGDPLAFKSFVQKYDDEATWEVFSELLLPDAPVQGGNFTVTLQSGDDWELDPAKTSATTVIVAADPLITVHAEQAAYSVAENHGTLTVTLIAETVVAGAPKPLSRTAIITWAAAADSAIGGGADFRDAGATELVFIGEDFSEEGGRWVATKEVEVTVVNDNVWEFDEEFHIALSRHVAVPPFRNHTHPLIKLANADGTLCEDNASGTNCGATVTILSNDNAAPAFSSATATREVAENSPADTNVGAPVTATDANTGDGDALTYSLEGTDRASFAIDATTGQITTTTGVDYDYETDPSYSVTVKATDRQDASATIAVTINLTDVAVEVLPAPLSALSLTGIEFNETFEAGVTAYTASVPHAATRTTVSATPETSGATVTISPADASGSLSGHQVDLDVGDTVITVTVESAGTRSVYSVTVTRSGPEVLSPLDASEELVKSFEMVAGAGNADGVVYGYGAAASGGSLTPTEFEWGGVTYEVTEILVNEDLDHLFVNFDPHPPTEAMAGLNLHIGADFILGGERYSYWVLQFSRSTRESNNSFSWGFAPAFGPYTNPFGREERAGTTVNLRLVTTETVAPTVGALTVSGARLVLTYDELLDETSVPDPDDFEVSVASAGGTAEPRDVTAVAVKDRSVRLTLKSRVRPREVVTLRYTPGSNRLRDRNGNDAAAIGTALAVANETGGNRAPSFDGVSWNMPPSFHITRQVAENSGGGVKVGEPIGATDPDGDSLSWSITRFQRTITMPNPDFLSRRPVTISTEWVEWGASAYFTIDSDTGQIRTKSGVDYDYETRRSYFVEVEVTDGLGAVARTDVLIELTDVGEPEDTPLSAPQELTLAKMGPTAVLLSWETPASGATVAKHQFRIGRHPTSVDGVLGGIGPQNPANRVLRDDGWMDFPEGSKGPLGYVLRGSVGGAALIHVWELKVQVRSVGTAGEVSRPSNVAYMPDTAPMFVAARVVSEPGSNGVYDARSVIAVEVELDEPVRVRGRPMLDLSIAGATRAARFTELSHQFRDAEVGWGADEGTIMRFEYRVPAGTTVDPDDIVIPRSVRLNGALVTDATRVGNNKTAILSWAAAAL